jgi:1-phosphatidylinositol-3-phosphate 5-kinase
MHPGRGMRSSIDERVPFQQGLQDVNTPLPAFHNDNIIDPDLAAFLSDDGSDDDDTPSIMAAVSGAGAGSLNERERLGFGSLFTTGIKKGRSRGETAGSSTRGGKDEDTPSHHAKKLSRHRHHSRNNLSATLEIDPMDFRRPYSPQKPADLRGAKVIRSSALRGENYPSVQMSPASLRHVKNLLAQLIDDSGIASPRAWEKALLPILLQCTIDVEPDVQRGDDMDIRHYIKLKKVPGGKPGDTSYVSGVVFSKNIALKTMARSISQPRILIVTFAIEYARHETHFMSLDPVIAQEQEYLQNLVNRIAALRPNVLLVQRHVSGTALKLLERAGITVAYNIKESVLAAVARVTQTTLIKSIDKLGIGHHAITECDSFDVKTYVSDGHRRTYIFLSGCQPDLGCTIVLRGADTDSLRKIKRVTEFMCYVAYNLKLEDWLMRDSNIAIPVEAVSCQLACRSSHGGQGLHPDFNEKEKQSAEEGGAQDRPKNASAKKTNFTYELIEKRNRSRLLSASPFVTFAQPYLLVQLRELEQNLARYRALTEQYAPHDSEKEDISKVTKDTFELVRPETVNAPASDTQSAAIREYLHAVHQARLDKATFTFQMQERQWDAFMNNDGIDPYDPFWHQKIVVLFSLVSSITSAPCSGPEILGIVYYTGLGRTQDNQGEDMPLGQYVEDLCFAASSTCQDCDKKMYDHHRQYVHGFGQLTVSIQRQATKKYNNSDIIWMWSACRECRQETTPTQMSQHTWKYSFAKYLELSFWSNPLGPRSGACSHDIHKDYLRYFSFRGMVVRFRYDPIDIYDVVAPRALVTWAVETDLVMKNEQYTLLEQRLISFTDSIRKRLDSINIDTLDEKKAAEAQDVLTGLRERAEDDHDELLHKLQQKYSQSRYYELVPLNRALRMMDEKAIAWDESFNDFERDYFPSETDIRKLATIQLRNMFLESQPQPTRANSESDTEEGAETPIAEKQPEQLSTSASDEALPPKAEEVLSSVVEEQKAGEKNAAETVEAVLGPETPSGNETIRATSPRKELEEAVEREDVKHLDLAIPYWNGDDNGTSPRSNSIHDLVMAGRSPSPAGQAVDESFATQPKPLSSGLLERIEQIRSSQAAGELEIQDSKIPRLADLRKAESSRPIAQVPPLLRAKSQPSHVPRINDDYSNTDDGPAQSIHASESSSQNEKRPGDRLHLGRLAMKVGKVAPSLIPRSIPFNNASHVSALAKHFEQMSREFEKERLREKRQRALRSRQARANPLASSRPVVEVYQNATDAVGEKSASNEAEPGAAVSREDFAETLHTMEPTSDPTPTEIIDDTRSSVDMSIADESVTSDAPTKGNSTETGTADEMSDSERITRRRKSSDPYSGRSPSTVRSPPSVADTTESVAESGSELTIPDHKKHAWLKYLAEFWSKRTASGWASLEYPLHGNEHVFEDSDIIVREDEPSSVIALTLACSDYRNKLENIRTQTKKQPHRTAFRAPATELSEPDGESDKAGVEASLLSESATHLKYSFSHGTFKSSCKIFYAESFDALRRKCGVADRFIESMSRCLKFDSKGGKSKSLFLRTLDGRFVIKSLQEVELKAFTKFAPDYFAFMSYTLFHGVPSVIAKMFGLYQVNIRNPATGIEFSYNLLIMENLFYERNPNRRFDLKGSMRNRKIESTGEADEVLLDENLVETIFESPLFVREHSRKHLQASVFNDTLWLCKQNVMDYSLMAGFDDGSKELVVGIIDCIRTYTWDKKLESWIKDRGKNKPTITSPKDYRNRFRVSMMQYVLQAPTCWHQFQVNMAPPKTLREREERGHEEEEGEGRVE